MRNKVYWIIKLMILFIVVNINISLSQNLSEDFKKFGERMLSPEGVSFTINQEITASEESATIESVQLNYTILGKNMRIHGEQIETVKTPEITLIVIHPQKIIICVKANKVEDANHYLGLLKSMNFETFLKDNGIKQLKPLFTETPSQKIYLIKDRLDIGIQELRIIFNKQNKMIENVFIKYAENQIGFPNSLSMSFSNFVFYPITNQKTFSIDEFISHSSEPWKLTDKYIKKGYNLDLMSSENSK